LRLIQTFPNKYPQYILRDQNQANWLRDANGNLIPNSGSLFSVITPYINQGKTEVRGLDFDFKIRNSLAGYGKLSSGINLSYILSFKGVANPGDSPFNVAGSSAGIANWSLSNGDMPKLKANAHTTWTKESHAITGTINFIDSVSLMRKYDGDTTYPVAYCQYGSGQPSSATGLGGNPKYLEYYPSCKVKSWTTFDTNYRYSGFKNMVLSFNIQNVFDQKAPYDPRFGSTGYNDTLHNAMGRYFSASINYQFH
jgi:iron complex outermembrane receptor protein